MSQEFQRKTNNLLRSIRVFQNLPEAVLSEIASYKVDKIYQKGEAIFHQGTQALAVYGIISGRLKLFKTEHNGKRHILRIAGPGGLLGDRSVFAEGLYHATAKTLEQCRIFIIDKVKIFHLLKKYPELSINFIQKLSTELKIADEMSSQIANRSVRARMASIILMLYKNHPSSTSENNSLDLTLTHEELGEMIGVSRETANRTLSNLKKEKMICISDNKIVILDLKNLSRIAKINTNSL